jgi:hypothetical protein
MNYKYPSPSPFPSSPPSPPTRLRIFRLRNNVGPFQSVQAIPAMLKLINLTMPLPSHAEKTFMITPLSSYTKIDLFTTLFSSYAETVFIDHICPFPDIIKLTLLITSGGYPALLGSKTFPVPAPVPAPVTVSRSRPVTVSRPRLFSRFFCLSHLKNQIFKMSFLNF